MVHGFLFQKPQYANAVPQPFSHMDCLMHSLWTCDTKGVLTQNPGACVLRIPDALRAIFGPDFVAIMSRDIYVSARSQLGVAGEIERRPSMGARSAVQAGTAQMARHSARIRTLEIGPEERLTGFSTRLSQSTFRWIVAFKMENRERDCCIAVSREPIYGHAYS